MRTKEDEQRRMSRSSELQRQLATPRPIARPVVRKARMNEEAFPL
jgi:hypothetical protein